jgi:thioredoxin-related protein
MKNTGSLVVMGLAAIIIFFTASNVCAISWLNNFDSAIKAAQDSGKPIMADFYTDWCGWCKKLDSETYSDDTVNTLSNSFVCVKINGDIDRELVTKYNVRGYPTIVFFDSNGNLTTTHVGYASAADMAKIMEGILKNSQKNPDVVQSSGKTEEKSDLEKLKNDTVKKIKKMQNSGLQLDGILLNPKNPKAIINNKIVKVGDTVEDAKVALIEADKVELTLPDGKKITLKME